MKATVFVRFKPEVADVQGRTVTEQLKGFGFSEVQETRIGKLIDLYIESGDRENAGDRLEQMCEKLLANPEIEDYEIFSVE